MARPRRVDPELVTQAQAAVRDADNVEALRCAQAVLLPALLGATLEQSAAVLGIGRATVPRLQARLRRLLAKPDAIRPNWGGRRRASLLLEEEDRFLASSLGCRPPVKGESWSQEFDSSSAKVAIFATWPQ